VIQQSTNGYSPCVSEFQSEKWKFPEGTLATFVQTRYWVFFETLIVNQLVKNKFTFMESECIMFSLQYDLGPYLEPV